MDSERTITELVTYHQLQDATFKEQIYQSLFTTSFMLLCSVSNPLFDEYAHTMKVEVELSNGQAFIVHMDYSDLVGRDFAQEGMTGRMINAVERAATHPQPATGSDGD